MSSEFQQKLGKKIKTLRESLGINQEELGFRAGISGSYVGYIENAKNDFKISKLEKIAKALGISVKELTDID